MKKWEYKNLVVTSNEPYGEMDKINSLGKQGWELVGFTTILAVGGLLSSNKAANQYVFKRELVS